MESHSKMVSRMSRNRTKRKSGSLVHRPGRTGQRSNRITALSTTRTAAAVLGLAFAVAAACSGGGSSSPQLAATQAGSPPSATQAGSIHPAAPTALPDPRGAVRLTLPGQVTVNRGPDITPTGFVGTIPNFDDSGHGYLPILAYDGGVLVRRDSLAVDTSDAQEYWWWSSVSGDLTRLWQVGDPHKQDVLTGTDGQWIATVRVGESLPFPDWELILRTPATGAERTIAVSDERVTRSTRLPVGLPSGFAPEPSISEGYVVWIEWAFGDDDQLHKYVRLYSIEADRQQTITMIDDPRMEDIRMASIGGHRLAWINDLPGQAGSHIVVHDFLTEKEWRFSTGEIPYRGRLSADGRFFAWDVAYSAKYALEIDSGRVDRFGDDEGQDIIVTSDGVSWAAGIGPNARGGYYDFDTRTVRRTAGSGGNASWLLGNGLFFFREFTVDERGQEIRELTTYYIVKTATSE